MIRLASPRPASPRLSSLCFVLVIFASCVVAFASEPTDPESAVRLMVQANAEKNLPTLSRLMAHDGDITSYSIGGRKYVGWPEFEREMREEFLNVQKLEIPILDLKVWTKRDVAWFAMELDYIRYVGEGSEQKRTVLPLRETGVLERRNGRWMLLSWHESFRSAQLKGPVTSAGSAGSTLSTLAQANGDNGAVQNSRQSYDVSGDWEMLEVEESRTYRATLDRKGNGPYTWQGGLFTTTSIKDRRWQGIWTQTGNDREGQFEMLLSEDGTQAQGIWWYTRVGTRNNIPPREHGGSYVWKRLTSPPSGQ
jgi:hypothetical protein